MKYGCYLLGTCPSTVALAEPKCWLTNSLNWFESTYPAAETTMFYPT